MVLARKRLKQKLRTLLPAGDGEAVAESGVEEEAQTIKERLDPSKRPRPKRPKKPSRQKPRVTEVEAAALRQQTEAEWRKEVERTRDERRKEKKEKRRNRRLMETEAAEKQKFEAESESENQKLEMADPAVGSDDPLVAEDSVQSLKTAEAEAEEKKLKLGVTGPAVGSNDPIMAEDSEQSMKKVYVGGIPYYSSEDDIRSFFEGCGSITALDCMTFLETGKFRGIAILTFKTDAAAQRALALDGADMGGFYLKIQPYKSNREKEDFAPKMTEGYNRIYVGNLAWDIVEDDLKKFFSDCKILSVRLGTDKETGDFKGYAHVDFSDGTSLAVAMKLDQKVIKGRPVRIRCAVPKKDNQKLNDNANSDSSKNRIRTCYECGTPGHLSSSCPNKKASEVISDGNKANINSATASSKKRRTCYECGIPGPLSLACPNKKAAEVVSDKEPDDEPKFAPSMVSEENKIGDESNSAPSKKRRKCYECGISGHLSSACPNKKATQTNSNEEKPNGSSIIPPSISDGKKASDDTNPVPPKKKKRRTCYECGIAGHLSSECPNKAAAEAK